MRLVARSRVLAGRANGSADPAICAAVAARFGGSPAVVAVGQVAHGPGPVARRIEAGWLPIPGVHRIRALRCASGEVTAFAGVGEPRGITLLPGQFVAWDRDRDPVGFASDRAWSAEIVDVTVGRDWHLTVNGSRLAVAFVDRVGAENAAWFLGWALVSAAVWSPLPFVVGASFTHYAIYLATFRAGREVDFGAFVRDAVVHKSASMLVLAALSSTGGPWSALSAALVVGGVSLSVWSARVLGLERTYFGVELGRIAPSRVARLPYTLVPHPMILGAMVALLGVGLLPGLRAEWPWLVPGHLALYVAHLVQELTFRHGEFAAPPPSGHPPDVPGR